MAWKLSIIDRIAERLDAVGYGALTQSEKDYWSVWFLIGECENGGLEQFFSNSTGELTSDAVHGLRAFGAEQTLALLEAAIQLFPDGQVPTDTQLRRAVMQNFDADCLAKLEELTNHLDDASESPTELMDQYYESHQDDFLGPRTLMERWIQRRTRGSSATQQRVNPVNLRKAAKQDRKLQSSRPCPQCGQPTPGYRMTCKKCGYPLGRTE